MLNPVQLFQDGPESHTDQDDLIEMDTESPKPRVEPRWTERYALRAAGITHTHLTLLFIGLAEVKGFEWILHEASWLTFAIEELYNGASSIAQIVYRIAEKHAYNKIRHQHNIESKNKSDENTILLGIDNIITRETSLRNLHGDNLVRFILENTSLGLKATASLCGMSGAIFIAGESFHEIFEEHLGPRAPFLFGAAFAELTLANLIDAFLQTSPTLEGCRAKLGEMLFSWQSFRSLCYLLCDYGVWSALAHQLPEINDPTITLILTAIFAALAGASFACQNPTKVKNATRNIFNSCSNSISYLGSSCLSGTRSLGNNCYSFFRMGTSDAAKERLLSHVQLQKSYGTLANTSPN